MKKKDTTPKGPVTASEIKSVITAEDDFGHEMRVGHILRCIPELKWKHGGTYTDPLTKKPRQFDYRCSLVKQSATHENESARLLLAVECKNLSPAVPLVVCGTKRSDNEAFHHLIQSRFGNFRRRNAWIDGPSSVTRRATRENSFYPQGHFVGKSTLRIQTDKSPYGAHTGLRYL